MKFSDLPPMKVKDWLTPEEIDEMNNNSNGELVFGLTRAKGRWLWHYRSDDFPTDAIPGSWWIDGSGVNWQMMHGNRWMNMNERIKGNQVFKEGNDDTR